MVSDEARLIRIRAQISENEYVICECMKLLNNKGCRARGIVANHIFNSGHKLLSCPIILDNISSPFNTDYMSKCSCGKIFFKIGQRTAKAQLVTHIQCYHINKKTKEIHGMINMTYNEILPEKDYKNERISIMAHALKMNINNINTMEELDYDYLLGCAQNLINLLNSKFDKYRLTIIGSLATKFLTPNSDGDIAVDAYDDDVYILDEIYLEMQEIYNASGSISYIGGVKYIDARVPIVKVVLRNPFYGSITRYPFRNIEYSIDISVSRYSVINTRLLQLYSSWHKNVEYAVIAMKNFFYKFGFVEKGRYLNSFCISLLVIFAMQHYDSPFKIPVLHDKALLRTMEHSQFPIADDISFYIPKDGEWNDKSREIVLNTQCLSSFGFCNESTEIISDEEYWIYAIGSFYVYEFDWTHDYVDIRCPIGGVELLSRDGCCRVESGECICIYIERFHHNPYLSRSDRSSIIIQDPVIQNLRFSSRTPDSWKLMHKTLKFEVDNIRRRRLLSLDSNEI